MIRFDIGGFETERNRARFRQTELGFGNLVAIQQFGTLPANLTEKNLRLLSGEVMPRVRHLGVTAAEPVNEPALVGE